MNSAQRLKELKLSCGWSRDRFILGVELLFEGKILTQTALTMAANVPYGSAIRRINELIDEGYILKRQRSKTGKSFSLHPSKQLIGRFEEYAFQLKSHIGVTFGFNEGGKSLDDFYFGASYMASSTLSYPFLRP